MVLVRLLCDDDVANCVLCYCVLCVVRCECVWLVVVGWLVVVCCGVFRVVGCWLCAAMLLIIILLCG